MWLGALGGQGRGWWGGSVWGEVELQQARPGKACGRGSGLEELLGSCRLVVFRKVRVCEAQVAQLGAEWSWDQ